MANVANAPRLPKHSAADQATNAQQQAHAAGTGVNQAILPNSRRDDSGGNGSGGGQHQGGSTEHQANAYGGQIRSQPAIEPWRVVDDSVLQNIGPFGSSTFTRGSIQRATWDRQYASTQGKAIRLAGDMPNTWSKQMSDEVDQTRLQHRPMNRDFVFTRYNVPLRA
jgi:hypothetical protein